MFGDIVTDLAAALQGGLGMAASGNIHPGRTSMFEPVHGSAPDIAGTGAANPLAMFLSAAMMLRHGFAMEAQAAALESAVDRALAEGLRTQDLGGGASTAKATQTVLQHL
jgi:3-isopropylmalate dehydrogenase